MPSQCLYKCLCWWKLAEPWPACKRGIIFYNYVLGEISVVYYLSAAELLVWLHIIEKVNISYNNKFKWILAFNVSWRRQLFGFLSAKQATQSKIMLCCQMKLNMYPFRCSFIISFLSSEYMFDNVRSNFLIADTWKQNL